MTDEQLFATYFAALVSNDQEMPPVKNAREGRLQTLADRVQFMIHLHRIRYPFKADPMPSLFGQVFGNRS